MKTRTINVYSFNELSPDARLTAKRKHEEVFGYAWGRDAIKSLEALANHFGAKLRDYSIDWSGSYSHSYAKFAAPEMAADDIAARLARLGSFNPKTGKGLGDCVLTGFCADEDAIDGFRAAWIAGERDLDRLLNAAFVTWLAAARADYAAGYDDDAFAEMSDANGWEYHANGTIA